MSAPTLAQAQKLLSLVPEHVTDEQMQKLLDSGLFPILFEGVHFSNVDRAAFRALLKLDPRPIDWTLVIGYPDKLRDWNTRFGLGLSDAQIDDLAAVLPDHAGPYQPTGISLTLGKGLEYDREVVLKIQRYELGKIGLSLPYDIRYGREYGQPPVLVEYYPGSEPAESTTPRLDVALLDVGRFCDSRGVVVREVRELLAGQRLPGLEVDWLIALNPQAYVANDYHKMPGLVAPGLVVDSDSVPSFGQVALRTFSSSSYPVDSRLYHKSVVVFRGC